MKDFWLKRGQSIVFTTILITLLLAINLFVNHKLHLIGAIIFGYLVATYYVFMLFLRLKKAMLKNKEEAKMIVRMGMIIRLFMFFCIMFLTMKISKDVFWCFLLGFFFFAFLLFINLIIFSLKDKIH